MPSPYKPPLMRRAQAVQSARGHARPRVRWAWLVPIVGLLPVVVAAVLASEGRFGSPSPRTAGPSAAAPAATPTVMATVTLVATDSMAGGAATRSTAGLTPTATAVTRSSDASGAPSATPGQGQTRAGAAPSVQAAPPAQAAPATDQSVVTSRDDLAAQTSPATGPFRSYRVQPGDTVKLIAETYGVSAISIAQASGLRDADRLRIGQVLTIPSQPGWLYRVKPGETLDQIAARTGIPSDLILSASQRADAVGAGDVILIPDQSLAPGK